MSSAQLHRSGRAKNQAKRPLAAVAFLLPAETASGFLYRDDHLMRAPCWFFVFPFVCTGCAVVTVADAALTVVSTTVKVGATVVETAVDVSAAGVKAVAGGSEPKK